MQELVRLRMRPSRDGRSFLYMLDFYDEQGKRRQLSLGHSDKRKAEAQRREKELELRAGVVGPGPMKLNEFREDCLRRTIRQVRSSTIRDYRAAMGDFMQCIGNIDIHHVKHEHGERYLRDCCDRGNAPATAAKKIRHVKRLLQLAVDRGQLEANPLRKLRVPKSPRRKVHVFSDEECWRLIKAAQEYDREAWQSVQWELLFHMALCTGMRWGEIMNTTWKDIDFENRIVEVSPKKDTPYTWEWHIKDTHRRTLPLANEVVEMLVAYQSKQPEGYPYVFLPPERYDYIQKLRKAGKWTVDHGREPSNNFHRTFRIILGRAGLEGEFHDLRRTCLSQWLANGLGEFDVMNLAGHSSFQTTHTFYLAASRDLVDRARAACEKSKGANLLRTCCAPPPQSDNKKGYQAQHPDNPALTDRAQRDSNPRPTD